MNCVCCSSIGINAKLIQRDEDLEIFRRVLFCEVYWLSTSRSHGSTSKGQDIMQINTTIKFIAVAIIALMMFASADRASAKQFTQIHHGREVVVHTNALPVILHRLVPPQHGRHVTAREVEKGQLPNATPRAVAKPRR